MAGVKGPGFWGSWVVILPQGHAVLLEDLHETHPGANQMKALAQSWCMMAWHGCWYCKSHEEVWCLSDVSTSPPTPPLHPWEWPNQPWFHLQLDFAGPFLDNMYLVLVDSHSKWMHVHIMQSITSENYWETQDNHRLPQKIGDNGHLFSKEYITFMAKIVLGTSHLPLITPQLMAWPKGRYRLSRRRLQGFLVPQFKRDFQRKRDFQSFYLSILSPLIQLLAYHPQNC